MLQLLIIVASYITIIVVVIITFVTSIKPITFTKPIIKHNITTIIAVLIKQADINSLLVADTNYTNSLQAIKLEDIDYRFMFITKLNQVMQVDIMHTLIAIIMFVLIVFIMFIILVFILILITIIVDLYFIRFVMVVVVGYLRQVI